MKQSAANIGVLGLVWLALISVGFLALMKYEYTPGTPATDSFSWPKDSNMQLMKSASTLVMFVHPHCPCTRASIVELSKIMTRHKDKLSAYVVILSPKTLPAGWEKTDIWLSAEGIPGVTVLKDTDGQEAKLFGSRTSGQTMVYNAQGELIHSGGITAARGQIGDNSAAQVLVASLERQRLRPAKTMVFGCSLLGR